MMIIRVEQITDHKIPERDHGGHAYDVSDPFGERVVTVHHGVHLNPGNATPAHGALPKFERDARDRVVGDDHRPPFLDSGSGLDPHRIVRVDGCWLIDTTPTPIGTAGGQ